MGLMWGDHRGSMLSWCRLDLGLCLVWFGFGKGSTFNRWRWCACVSLCLCLCVSQCQCQCLCLCVRLCRRLCLYLCLCLCVRVCVSVSVLVSAPLTSDPHHNGRLQTKADVSDVCWFDVAGLRRGAGSMRKRNTLGARIKRASEQMGCLHRNTPTASRKV